MSNIYRPNPNLSAFGAAPTALDSISKIFDNNQINAADAVKSGLQNAEMANYRAKVSEEQAKQDQRTVAAQEAENLASIFAPTLPQTLPEGEQGPIAPGQSIEQKLNDPTNLGKINRSMINLSLKAGQPSADIANLLRAVSANSAVPDAILARSVVGAGGNLGENEALSIAGQDRIRAGNTTNTIRINAAKPNSNTYIMPPGTNINDVPDYSPGGTIFDNIDKSTGPVSAATEKVANIAGFFGGSVAPDVVRARQDAEIFSTRLVNSMRVNSKFSEGERKDLAKKISVEPNAWTSPEVAKQRVISMDNTLADIERKTIADSRDPYMSKADRQAAQGNLRAIREARSKLGVPQSGNTSRGNDNKLPDPGTPAPDGNASGIKFLGFE